MQKLTGLNEVVKDLDGNPLDIQAGRLVANCIMGSQQKDAVRAYSIAVKINEADEAIELEDADYKMAKQAVESSQLPVMTKKYALDCFLELTEDDLG